MYLHIFSSGIRFCTMGVQRCQKTQWNFFFLKRTFKSVFFILSQWLHFCTVFLKYTAQVSSITWTKCCSSPGFFVLTINHELSWKQLSFHVHSLKAILKSLEKFSNTRWLSKVFLITWCICIDKDFVRCRKPSSAWAWQKLQKCSSFELLKVFDISYLSLSVFCC